MNGVNVVEVAGGTGEAGSTQLWSAGNVASAHPLKRCL